MLSIQRSAVMNFGTFQMLVFFGIGSFLVDLVQHLVDVALTQASEVPT